ncbi:MAG TPA: heparan-alpha-glucosaminide N-acetyltransferase [Ramlibacter sp.]|nr:heparan-alpha-glucosaminide N-acetyltransferase [Ramlibacter sp.]
MAPRRLATIDSLRGIAIVWMTVFHFCFDLNHFGWIKQNFYTDPFWTWQRTAIVSLFLFCAGLGQAVAAAQDQSWRRFWKRWAQIAGCALLVTAGSYWMFPRSFIYFGVLHGIALMLVIVRLTAGWGRSLWLAGAVALAMKPLAVLAHQRWPELEFLNQMAWNWLGLIDRKPVTEDYVPLLPWLGVMWWGLAAGQWLLAERRQWVERAVPAAAAPLAWLGRWSLSWYMLHQPVLIAAMTALSYVIARP